MERYTSARPMSAGKIKEVVREQRGGGDTVTLVLEGDDHVDVGVAFDAQYSPQPGGYYVVYDSGHKMYSPAEHFEAHHQKL